MPTKTTTNITILTVFGDDSLVMMSSLLMLLILLDDKYLVYITTFCFFSKTKIKLIKLTNMQAY